LAGHVTRMGRKETRAEFWLGNPKERDHVEHMGVSGGTNIKWKLKGMFGG